MEYFYNYSFLDKWMEANGDITNKQIMKLWVLLAIPAWIAGYG